MSRRPRRPIVIPPGAPPPSRCGHRTWKNFTEARCTRVGSLYENGAWWCRNHAPSIQADLEQRILQLRHHRALRRTLERELEALYTARELLYKEGGDLLQAITRRMQQLAQLPTQRGRGRTVHLTNPNPL